jgi:hypothetical protein
MAAIVLLPTLALSFRYFRCLLREKVSDKFGH